MPQLNEMAKMNSLFYSMFAPYAIHGSFSIYIHGSVIVSCVLEAKA